MSGDSDGTDWVNNSRFSTSPVSIPLGGANDGERLFAVIPGLDELVGLKQKSIYAVNGNDQRDFATRQITSEYGTIYPWAVSQYRGVTLFVSNRGLEAYSPPFTIQFVGANIETELKPLAASNPAGKYYWLTSQSQWGQGTTTNSINITSNSSPGDLYFANFNYVIT